MTFTMDAKDPVETVLVTIDWSAQLVGGDQISTSTWTPQAGITQSGAAIDTTKTKTTVFIASGTAGTTYTLVNTIVTVNGATYKRTINVPVATL